MPETRGSVEHVYVGLSELMALKRAGQGVSLSPHQPVHSQLSGRHGSRLRGRGLSFEELRGYRPGDDIRSMDWKATARTRKAQVRVYSEERERPVLFVVDQRQSMFFGSVRDMKSVTAAQAAALGAWRVVGAGDRVGAVVFDDRGLQHVRPHRSERAVRHMLGVLCDYNHALGADRPEPGDPRALNRVLGQVARLVSHDYLVVIVSDFDGADAETRHTITQLRRNNDVMVVHVVDPMDETLPSGAVLTVSDGVRQVQVDVDDSSLRKDYTDQYADLIARIKGVGAKYDVPVLRVSTAEPVTDQLRALLGRSTGTRRV